MFISHIYFFLWGNVHSSPFSLSFLIDFVLVCVLSRCRKSLCVSDINYFAEIFSHFMDCPFILVSVMLMQFFICGFYSLHLPDTYFLSSYAYISHAFITKFLQSIFHKLYNNIHILSLQVVIYTVLIILRNSIRYAYFLYQICSSVFTVDLILILAWQ